MANELVGRSMAATRKKTIIGPFGPGTLVRMIVLLLRCRWAECTTAIGGATLIERPLRRE